MANESYSIHKHVTLDVYQVGGHWGPWLAGGGVR